MVLTKEDRIALLEKARAVKASKKAERDAEKIPPKKGRPPAKKPQSKILDLGEVADETNVEELAEDIKNMQVNKKEPAIEPERPQQEQEEEQEVEIIEEIIKKKKKPKKKIIRRYIEPSSSEDEQEIIEEFIKKKPKQPKISPRYEPYAREEPTPIQLTPPTLNLFCY
jgi:hypothetical protein